MTFRWIAFGFLASVSLLTIGCGGEKPATNEASATAAESTPPSTAPASNVKSKPARKGSIKSQVDGDVHPSERRKKTE